MNGWPHSCHRPECTRDRYHGVPAPNSPLRDLVTAIAQQTTEETPSTTEADKTDGPDALSRSPVRCLWATLIARLFDIFPLTCRYFISAQAIVLLCHRLPTLTDDRRYVRFWPTADKCQTSATGSFESGAVTRPVRSERPLRVDSGP